MMYGAILAQRLAASRGWFPSNPPMKNTTILKSEFFHVSDVEFKPNWFTRFFFTKLSDHRTPLRNFLMWLDVAAFALMFIFIAFNIDTPLTVVAVWLYAADTFGVVIWAFIATRMNNSRLNRICKRLDITKQQYEDLLVKFSTTSATSVKL